MKHLNLWIMLCMMTLTIPEGSTILAQQQTPLYELLSHEGCNSACWQGIEVGETTEAELQQFLSTNGISYDSGLLGTQGHATSYSISSNFDTPPLSNGSSISIVTATDGPVSAIMLSLDNVDVNSVIETYGYPDRIIEYFGDPSVIYANEGIEFRIANNNDVFLANIMGVAYTTQLFIEQSLGPTLYNDVIECTDDSQLCEVVAAMNVPSAQSELQLRNLLTDPNCDAACLLGIEPGVTDVSTVTAILDAQNIIYHSYPPSFGEPGLMFNIYDEGQVPQIFPLAGSPNDQILIVTDDEIVHDIDIGGIEQVTVSDVLEAFGPPSYITIDVGYYWLLYENLSMTFQVEHSSVNIVHIHLHSPFSLSFVHPEGDWGVNAIHPCTEPIALCEIITTKHPTSAAGVDATFSIAESITLDGSGSSDPDGTIVAYSWTDESGTEIATGPTPTVDLPVGVHTITLAVTNDNGLTASDEVVITITSAAD